MNGSELHAQAAVWQYHDTGMAVLFMEAPIGLPPGWLRLATGCGMVEVFVGHHLGLHEHAHDGDAHPAALLERAAVSGELAAGGVRVCPPGQSIADCRRSTVRTPTHSVGYR